MKPATIHLGYEIGTGDPVSVPLAHTAVTGQTQRSGKTTTLEAMVSRAELPALAFVTKRGEGSFAAGRRLRPYFRDRADWQFVTSIIDATLQEKNKFLRPWIMKICRTTRTLADVQRAVREALKTAKGINEGVYTQLDEYLELIVPEIARVNLSRDFSLEPGLNVMDVSSYGTPMQMLFVQSAIDWMNASAHGTVTIVPEAWEFIPEGKGSPVKGSAVSLVRKGAGLKNFIWVDSQDMAGVDKTILRGCTVWIIGVQREANEIRRTLANIPAHIRRPKPADVAMLKLGQFFACYEDQIHKVYVQPAWMRPQDAIQISRGERPTITSPPPPPVPQPPPEAEDDEMSKEDVEAIRGDLRELTGAVRSLVSNMDGRGGDSPPPAKATVHTQHEHLAGEPLDQEQLYQSFKRRLLQEETPALVQLATSQPELVVSVQRKTYEYDDSTSMGQFAKLIATGYFKEPTSGQKAYDELRRLGVKVAKPTVYDFAKKFAGMGILTIEDGGFQVSPSAIVRKK